MNSITFNGRQEVMYGLYKAASRAQEIAKMEAHAKGPRPILNREKIAAYKGSMQAYLDMVTNDDAYLETLDRDLEGGKTIHSGVAKILQQPYYYAKRAFEIFADELGARSSAHDIVNYSTYLNTVKSMLKF